MSVLFISDLHLCSERPLSTQLFLEFLTHQGRQARSLYILGDLFESWVGDDVLQDPQAGQPYQSIIDALRQYSDAGTPVYLMHGNRDFLVGSQLAERCHFTLINDPHKIKIRNKDALLMHGDTLCTDDIEYQKFRQMVRSQEWQQQILSKTLAERIEIARSLREKSQQSTSAKDEYIMDVNQNATDKAFIDNNVDLIIHGHTHRPAIHHRTVNGIETTRIVLGDWYNTGSYLRIKNSSPLLLQTYQ
jgi:UDP-2,3-diacylglucosamine hydrolase